MEGGNKGSLLPYGENGGARKGKVFLVQILKAHAPEQFFPGVAPDGLLQAEIVEQEVFDGRARAPVQFLRSRPDGLNDMERHARKCCAESAQKLRGAGIFLLIAELVQDKESRRAIHAFELVLQLADLHSIATLELDAAAHTALG